MCTPFLLPADGVATWIMLLFARCLRLLLYGGHAEQLAGVKEMRIHVVWLRDGVDKAQQNPAVALAAVAPPQRPDKPQQRLHGHLHDFVLLAPRDPVEAAHAGVDIRVAGVACAVGVSFSVFVACVGASPAFSLPCALPASASAQAASAASLQLMKFSTGSHMPASRWRCSKFITELCRRCFACTGSCAPQKMQVIIGGFVSLCVVPVCVVCLVLPVCAWLCRRGGRCQSSYKRRKG